MAQAMAAKTQNSNTDKEMLTMAEEEFSRLQRQLRIMEEDKVAFLEEYRLKLDKQKKIIQILQKEKDMLNEDLVVITCESQTKKDKKIVSKINDFVEQYKKYTDVIRNEKEELKELEVQIRKTTALKNMYENMNYGKR